jgi:hypothetical protein
MSLAQLVRKVYREQPERKESKEKLDLLAPRAQLVYKVRLAQLEPRVYKEIKVSKE